jgi:hypothetical protein
MKLPPEISRLALGSPQVGQSVNFGSLMRCSTSQFFPQASQVYS